MPFPLIGLIFGAISVFATVGILWIAWQLFKGLFAALISLAAIVAAMAVIYLFIIKKLWKEEELTDWDWGLGIGIPIILVLFGVGLFKLPIFASILPAASMFAQAPASMAILAAAGETMTPQAATGLNISLGAAAYFAAFLLLIGLTAYGLTKKS